MHPARTVRNTVTPHPVRQASRAAYSVRRPAAAAENKLIGSARYPHRPSARRRGLPVIGAVIIGFILFIVNPWLGLGAVLAIAIPAVARRRTR
jgi:hypothetical protein